MALLEAMLFHQQQQQEEDLQFSYGSNSKDLYALLAATATATCYDNHQDQDHFHKFLLQQDASSCGGLYGSSSPKNYNSTSNGFFAAAAGGCFGRPEVHQGPPATGSGRRKRRRTKSLKNKEELENQRMTHITVERNRRKQMNQYLAVLRSMMPPSYVQRGDQGSIVGGAINYVKELEHLLQTLEAEKQINNKQQQPQDHINSLHSNNNHSIFSDFFAYPQYSTRSSTQQHDEYSSEASQIGSSEKKKKKKAAADVEVTMVEGHANVKVQSRRRPKQLLKMVVALHSLRLTVLHLNVATHHLHALYSFSVKVEEDCELSSVNEIAAAVNEMVRRIHQTEELEP